MGESHLKYCDIIGYEHNHVMLHDRPSISLVIPYYNFLFCSFSLYQLYLFLFI